MLHHSADSSPFPQFDKINMSHRNRGFPRSSLGFWCGYGFVIDTDAKRWQARQPGERGAHTAAVCSDGHCNDVTTGVCIAGDFTTLVPTEAQLSALYLLWKDLTFPPIMLHKDVKNTACPGSFDFRAALQERRLPDLQKDLKLAESALFNKLSPTRKRMLLRKISRLKQLLLHPDAV